MFMVCRLNNPTFGLRPAIRVDHAASDEYAGSTLPDLPMMRAEPIVSSPLVDLSRRASTGGYAR
jgi:hypothetical protein